MIPTNVGIQTLLSAIIAVYRHFKRTQGANTNRERERDNEKAKGKEKALKLLL